MHRMDQHHTFHQSIPQHSKLGTAKVSRFCCCDYLLSPYCASSEPALDTLDTNPSIDVLCAYISHSVMCLSVLV